MTTIKNKEWIHFLKNSIRLLADIYWGPTIEICKDMINGTYLSPFEQLNKLPDLDISGLIKSLHQSIASYSSADQLFIELERVYIEMFINALEGIQTPLYHSCYLEDNASDKGLLMGDSAVEMLNRYEDAGLTISEDIKEPPDHISLELEYLYFLMSVTEAAEEESFQSEINEYISDFMLPWINIFLERIQSNKEKLIYPQLTSILVAVLENTLKADMKIN